MSRKIYTVGPEWGYTNWMEGEGVDNMEDADLVVFTGGEDVTPILYGAKRHPTTGGNLRRDAKEVDEFTRAKRLDKKMIGICRGAQLLCVMAGGSLIQHQIHPWRHEMETKDGDITITSLHHQRQYPWGNKKPRFHLLGWTDHLSPFSFGESFTQRLEDKPEVEVAIYPDIKALAIQAHPEMAYPSRAPWEEDFIKWCRKTLDEFMA
jgi:GMP synthase-like glutamine amidotransferase